MSRVKKIAAIVGWVMVSILAFLALLVLVVQISFVKEKIKTLAEHQLAEQLNGTLTIGRLNGNFISNLSLDKLQVQTDSLPVLEIDRVQLNYKLLALISGKVKVNHVLIDAPKVELIQYADSSWNYERLIPPSTDEEVPDTAAFALPFAIELQNFEIKNACIAYRGRSPSDSLSVNQLNLQCEGYWFEADQGFDLQHLSFSSSKPQLALELLAFKLRRNQQSIALQDFHLRSAQNELKGRAKIDSLLKGRAGLELETAPLQWEEFSFMLPDVTLPFHPQMKLSLANDPGGLQVELQLSEGDTVVRGTFSSDNLLDVFLNGVDQELHYSVAASTKNLDLAGLVDPEMEALVVNADIALQGQGIEPRRARVQFEARLDQVSYDGLKLTNTKIQGWKRADSLQVELNLTSNFGKMQALCQVNELFEQPQTDLQLKVQQLDAAPLMQDEYYRSSLNFDLSCKAEGLPPEIAVHPIHLSLAPSHILDVEVQGLDALLSYKDGVVHIDSLEGKTSDAELVASGYYSLDSTSAISLNGKFSSVDDFKTFFTEYPIGAKGEFSTTVNGTYKDLRFDGLFLLDSARYSSFVLAKAKVTMEALYRNSQLEAKGRLWGSDFGQTSAYLDTVMLDYYTDLHLFAFDGSTANAYARAKLKCNLYIDDSIPFYFPELQLRFADQDWTLNDKNAYLVYDSIGYTIHNFELYNLRDSLRQQIIVDGTYSENGKETLNLNLHSIDLEPFVQYFDSTYHLEGYLNTVVSVVYDTLQPMVNASVWIDSLAYEKVEIPVFTNELMLEKNKLSVLSYTETKDGGYLKGTLEGSLYYDGNAYEFSTKPDDSVQGEIDVNAISLGLLEELELFSPVSGNANGVLTVSGQVEEPEVNGSLYLSNTSFSIPEYNLAYHDIDAIATISNEYISLDSLQVFSKDGRLAANGELLFNKNFYSSDLADSRIKLNFDDFNVLDHQQLSTKINGDVVLSGNLTHASYGGELSIDESEFHVMALLNLIGQSGVPESPQPMLVQELEKSKQPVDEEIQELNPEESSFSTQMIMDSLTGSLRLIIPKNTWIKKDGTHIELAGEITVAKNNPYFELFGNVRVLRGQIDLMGKVFLVDHGYINFNGGADMMPELDIQAHYTFRDSRKIEQELMVNIGGNAEEPTVQFSLNNKPLNEGDALSYLLFGKHPNELSLQQQEDVSVGSAQDLALQAATSVVSGQITKFLRKQLNVDYIEVKSGAHIDQASILVGKYITNDLFVSYQQHFGETDEKDVDKYEINLEYELLKFLFLQLNNSSSESGVDLILKLEK